MVLISYWASADQYRAGIYDATQREGLVSQSLIGQQFCPDGKDDIYHRQSETKTIHSRMNLQIENMNMY